MQFFCNGIIYSYIVVCHCAVTVHWFLSVVVATWISFTKKEVAIISSSLWPFHMWSVISKYAKFNGCWDFYFNVRVIVPCFVMYDCYKMSSQICYVIIACVFVFGLLSCFEALISNKQSSHWVYYIRQQKCLDKLVSSASSLSLLSVIVLSIWILFYSVLCGWLSGISSYLRMYSLLNSQSWRKTKV